MGDLTWVRFVRSWSREHLPDRDQSAFDDVLTKQASYRTAQEQWGAGASARVCGHLLMAAAIEGGLR